MALTAQQIETLIEERTRALGLAGERFGERSVQYGNLVEAIAYLKQQLAETSGTSGTRIKRKLIATSKGY